MSVFSAGAVLLLAGCGGSDDPDIRGSGDDADVADGSGIDDGADRTPVTDGTFQAVIANDPGNLDPQMTILGLTRWVTTFMYDSLVFIAEDGTIEPYLAESWEVDLDSLTYTLKDGVTCADGTPLTASDVAENFAFVTDPANQSPQLGIFVQPGLEASADDDAGTVTLTTAHPDPFLLQGTGMMQIVCAAGNADRSILAEGSAGTGMFELIESVPGDRYTFQRRDDYAWGPAGAAASDPGTPEQVTLRVVANEATAVNMFLSGELSAVLVEGPDVERLEQAGMASLDTSSLFSELMFNQGDSRPGSDPAVRQALAGSVDLASLGAVLTDGRGTPPDNLGVLDPRPCPADTVAGVLPEYDPDAAAAALDAAGWTVEPDGVRAKDGQRLEVSLLHIPEDGAGVSSGAELLAQEWAAIGVDVTLQPITTAQINEVLFGTSDWDAALIRLTVAFPSQLVPLLSGEGPPNGTNFAHLDNDEYQQLTAQAAQLPVEEGCTFWEDAERVLIAEADVVPIVNSVAPWFLDGVDLRLLAGRIAPPTVRLYE
ncbi:ABC transporter substrate-binding protein [Phytoactinopolyspora limicola]|uniref:ABC transporter substrate-binding protein n=1 Tax=Phytoactinopolyspora limicola TaxID=2715536 RepID=UPI001A9C4AD5|nr:ABC transporter substrate-binding protein [Phytoactinopolyspora limicola]